jgi:hypothetical protein
MNRCSYGSSSNTNTCNAMALADVTFPQMPGGASIETEYQTRKQECWMRQQKTW